MHILSLPIIALFIALGALAGFLAGLLGIGGGIILVPVFLAAFPIAGFAPDIVVHAALGTSLAIILPTALSSSFGHRRRGNVQWHQVLWMALGGTLGAVSGATLAAAISGDRLKGFFGLMLILVGVKLFTHHRRPPPEREKGIPRWQFILVGVVGGSFSAFFGVGGGVVTVPLMVLVLQLPIHLAVGNASALIVVSSFFGALSYIFHGWGMPEMPAFSLGYVNLLVVLLVAPFTIVFARVGVLVAGKLNRDRLLRVFSLLQIGIGLKIFISVFFL